MGTKAIETEVQTGSLPDGSSAFGASLPKYAITTDAQPPKKIVVHCWHGTHSILGNDLPSGCQPPALSQETAGKKKSIELFFNMKLI